MVGSVFVDTSAIVALLDRADPRHAEVSQTFGESIDTDLVTHGYVVAETLAVVRQRFGVDGATTVIDDLLPLIRLAPVDADVFGVALEAYRRSLPSGTSFVDRLTLAVMARDSIELLFAVDGDFDDAGVRLLPAPARGRGRRATARRSTGGARKPRG